MRKWCAVLVILILIAPAIAASISWNTDYIPITNPVRGQDSAYNSSDILHIVYQTSTGYKLRHIAWDPISKTLIENEDITSGQLGFVDVEIDASDTIHVMYRDYYLDYRLKYTKKEIGGSWSTPVDVSQAAIYGYGDDDRTCSMALSNAGIPWFIWTHDSTRGVYVSRLEGETVTVEEVYDSGTSTSRGGSAIEFDDENNLWIFYHSPDDSTSTILAKRTGPNTFDTYVVKGELYQSSRDVAMKINSTGFIFMAWSWFSDYDYYCRPTLSIYNPDTEEITTETFSTEEEDYEQFDIDLSDQDDTYYISMRTYGSPVRALYSWTKYYNESSFDKNTIMDIENGLSKDARVTLNSTRAPTVSSIAQNLSGIYLFTGPSSPLMPTPTPTPTPSSTSPSAYGGRPDVPFPQPTYSGVEVISCTPHPDNRVTLVGRVTNTTTDPTGWFILGTDSDAYAYHTVMLDTDDEGFFVEDVSGLPLTPGDTFYVRAVTESGRSPFEISFTMEGLPTVLPTTFGHYWQMIDRSNKSLPVFVGVIPRVFVDYFGEDSTLGWQVFYLMIFGVGFLVMFGRQRNVIIPMLVFMIAGYFIIQLIPSEMQALAYGLTIVCAMGVIFYIVRKGD